MQRTKLIDLLKSLTKAELRQFEKQLEIQGKEDRQLLLLKYLKKYGPSYQSTRLDKEKVAAKLFPKDKGGVKKLSYVGSALWKSLKEFIVDLMLEEQPFVRKKLLLEFYKKRKLDKFFFSQLNKMENDLEQDKVRGIDYYYQMFQLSHLTYSHPSTTKQTTEIKSLENSMNYIDLFYAITKLKYSCEMITRERILNNNYDIVLLEPILELSETDPFRDNPIIGLYQQLIRSIQNLNYGDMQQLKEVYKSHFHLLSNQEQRDVLIYITNNFFMLYRSSNKEAIHDQLELYQFGLAHKIWMEDGYIFHLHFMNIFNTACIVKELDWAENFILEYSELLPEENRQNTISLCSAHVNFKKKNFEKTLEYLRDVVFSEIHFNIVAKNTILKCYYELEDYEMALHDFLHAYTMYLKRNKTINNTFKEANLNLIKFTRRAVKERHFKQEGKDKLLLELAAETNISDRTWLQQKISVLK